MHGSSALIKTSGLAEILCPFYLMLLFISGIWREWIEQQNTHETIAEMDERKEDAEAFLHPSWFQQEISAFYSRWSSGRSVEEFFRIRSPETEETEATKEKKAIKIDLCWRLLDYHAVAAGYTPVLFICTDAGSWRMMNLWVSAITVFAQISTLFGDMQGLSNISHWLVPMHWLINMHWIRGW